MRSAEECRAARSGETGSMALQETRETKRGGVMMVSRGYMFADGTSIFVGHLPFGKRPYIYIVDGSVLRSLGQVKDDEAGDELLRVMDKLARGGLGDLEVTCSI